MDVVRRPRIEGAREREILDITTELLTAIGYDRLTIDAVAAAAKVSKASIYRLWGDKSALVAAAVECQGAGDLELPDTGSVLTDLSELVATRGFFDAERGAVISALATAIHREPERHHAVRQLLVDNGTKHVRALLARAVDRGQLAGDVDVELLSSVIPAMVLYRITYQTVGSFDEAFVADLADKILAPVLREHLIGSTTTASANKDKGKRGSSSRR